MTHNQKRDQQIRDIIARFEVEEARLRREADEKAKIAARWRRLLTCPNALAGTKQEQAVAA
jgi:hypothetical protein